jgi:hypothetical protein
MKTLKTLSLNNYLLAVPTTRKRSDQAEGPRLKIQWLEAIKLRPNGAPGALGSTPD